MVEIIAAQNEASGVLEKKTIVDKEKEEKKVEKKEDKKPRADRAPSPEYTPLNARRLEILMQIKGKGLLNQPVPMFSKPEDRNPKKYYRFHRDTGHDTKDCRQLKREIENLIRDGHLLKYVDRRKDSRPDHKEEERHVGRDDRRHDKERVTNRRGEPTRETGQSSRPLAAPILTTLGGLGQESARKAKAHAGFIGVVEATTKIARTDLTISFASEDMEGINWPHDDAIVLQMFIQDRMVHKILVDTGASVDLLSYQAFKQFGLGEESLRPDGNNLYRFSGEAAKIEGSIKMPVTVGEYPNEVTVEINFMVVSNGYARNPQELRRAPTQHKPNVPTCPAEKKEFRYGETVGNRGRSSEAERLRIYPRNRIPELAFQRGHGPKV
ncbi:uncharacterized protein LOC122643642 [Telopea speciosissima]|uniref:uncharacterized protein LOC122643642 n=1 Tax=Telopea speciosissima TaxID=54955 RepID=UPI001CC633F2|nr:uncharacterized protein LOC122643642 [Telopea speciosissima]